MAFLACCAARGWPVDAVLALEAQQAFQHFALRPGWTQRGLKPGGA
jgi:hypothetical protein